MKKSVFILVAILIGFIGITSYYLKDKYVVPVLMYHNILPCDEECPANTVSPQAFKYQMEFLKKHGYNVLTVKELVDGIIAGDKFEHNSVVITFDDGNEDNYLNAWPVLKKLNIPAMSFVSPHHIGKPGFMTWPQVKEMDLGGFEIGSHTMTQAYLPEVNGEQLVWEVVASKGILEHKLGRPVDYFAYPIGGFSEKIKTEVRDAGYKAAFATNRGYDRFNKDVYEINRIRVKSDDSDIELWVKLSGFYNLLRKLKHPF